MTTSPSPAPQPDINVVLANHQQQLLALPDVVGVYVGLMKDEKTLCLKVMLARRNSETERRLPQIVDGYQVVTEVTGEIRPLDAR